MVLATKRAVGSEYVYPSYQSPPAQRQKVRVRAKRKASPVAGILVISLFFALGLSYTFLQATKAQMNLRISKAEENIAALKMDNEKLKLEVAALNSLDRIESIATSQLQMVKPPKVEYLAFQEGLTGDGKDLGYLAATEAEDNIMQADGAEHNNLLEKIVAAISNAIRGDGSDSRWSEEIVSTY